MNRLLDTIIGIVVALVINLAMPGATPIKPPEPACECPATPAGKEPEQTAQPEK